MEEKRSVYGLFNDSFPPVIDGVTLTMQNYVRWLVDSGRKVCVITPWNPFDPVHPDFEMHRYFSLPIYNRRPYRYGYPKVDPFIWHNIRRVPFKIVHAHCPFSSGRLAQYAARYHKVPLVATFHSKYRVDLEHSLPAWMVRRQMKKIMRFYESCDEVWIPQGAVEETLREYGYRGDVKVVENGIDFGCSADSDSDRREARRRLGMPADRLQLLFVGQHILEKGVDVIIDALAALDGEGVDFGMSFIGTGYATDEMAGRVKRAGISDKVKFYGVINDRSVLRDHYAAADLFLFPSFYDNAPLVVREAASAGTPALLLEGSTAAEMITDGVNGFLTGRSGEEYCRVITRLASDRQAIRRAGEGARSTLSRSWNNVMEEVIGRYDDIIKRYEYQRR